MQRLSQLASQSLGFAVILAILITALLAIVGLGPNALPFPPQSPYSDAVISHWPNALYLQESVRAGQFPAWRDLLMGGQPFAANPLNKVWYPFQWLVLLLPPILHLNILVWCHLLLAGIGMRLLGLHLGLKAGSASIIGIAYALTPRLAAALGAGHLDIVYACAWLPWLLWAVHRLVSPDTRSIQLVALLGGLGALCFLADLRISVFCFAFALAFGLWLAWSLDFKEKRRLLSFAIISTILAGGLSAVEWLPLLPLTPYLSRNGLTVEDAAVFSLLPQQFIGLVTPDRGGFQETMIYPGIMILMFAAIGFLRAPRRHWFWLAAIIIGGLYALGSNGPLWSLFVRIIPPLLWLRVPARAWIVVVVALLVLAGFGIEALTERSTQRRLLRPLAVALIGAGGACGVASTMLPLRPGAGLVALLGLLSVAVLLLVSPRLSAVWLTIAVGALIVFDLVWMDVTLVQGRSSSKWLGQYASLAQAVGDAHVARLYSPDYSLPQQVAVYWHIPMFGGVDPFQLKDFVAGFESATGTHASGYSVTLPPFENGDVKTANRNARLDAVQLAHWNVSHVLASFAIDNPDLRLLSRPNDLYLYENMQLKPGVVMAWDGPNRFTAINYSSAPVNVAAWAPGWDTPANGPGITVQPGETLTANYSPPNLVLALAISGLSLMVTIAMLVVENRHL